MKNDLTVGSPIKQIFFFMLPLLIGNIFQQFYNIVNTIIVGQILGVEALASVGATGGLQFVIFGFASGMSGGVTVITAQWVGAKDTEQVSRSVAAAYKICAVVAVTLTILGLFICRWLLTFMNTPGDILERSVEYQRVMIAGLSATIFYNLMAGIMRAFGDSRTPLFFLIAASFLNVILDYGFILFLNAGVTGPAYATVISQTLSGIACLLYSMKKYPFMKLRKYHWKTDFQWTWSHVRVGLSMALQNSITGIGVMVFQSALNSFGSPTVAAFTACSKVESIAIMPMFAIGSSLSTFIAQNFGARQVQRVRQGVKICIIMNLILSILGSVVVVNLYRPLIQIFIGKDQPQVVDIARVYLQIVGSCYFAAAFLFVYRAAMQGLGNAVIPMIGGGIELTMRVLSALLLANIFGFAGLSFAYPLAWAGAAIPSIVSYYFCSRRRFGICDYQENGHMDGGGEGGQVQTKLCNEASVAEEH